MDEKQYIRQILRKIRCTGGRKREIRRQMESDISFRLSHGEKLGEIISDMGAPEEIAQEFNESLSDAERKAFLQRRTVLILFAAGCALLLIMTGIIWMLPKSRDLAESRYFDEREVRSAIERTVGLCDEDDMDALRSMSSPQMIAILEEQTMQQIKAQIADDWGSRISLGTIYLAEVTQYGQHIAVGEVTVNYEKVTVIYRLSYDADMRLVGFYVR